ncbi:MAG: hypothetical protein PF692_02170 [Kiritimatiellae bacterium]|nr:hypothetical protein [Kiritimatiellia bacterium]
MKKKIITVIAIISMISAFTVNAAYTESHDNTSTYLTGIQSMSSLQVGLSASTLDRKLKDSNYDLEGYKATFDVGVDLLKWLTVYGKAGVVGADFKSDVFGTLDGSDEFTYGFGAEARILNHDILDSFGAIDKVRITAWGEYDAYSTETRQGDFDWEELYVGAVFAIVNDINGEPGYALESMSLFAGPVYSKFFGDLTEKQSVGLTGGIQAFFTARVSAEFGFNTYDLESPSMYGSVTVQF